MVKIGIIVPKDTINTAKSAAEEFEEEIAFFEGSMYEGIKIANRLEEDGYDVIIARGVTQILLMESNISIPIISVPITPVDIFDAINRAEDISEDLALIISKDMISAVENYERIAGKTFRMLRVKDEIQVEQKMKLLAEEGKRVVVGLGIIAKYAPLYGLIPIVIKSGREAFISTIEEAIRIATATRKEKEDKERIKAIIENSSEGIISINRGGYINVFNNTARKLFGFHDQKIVGEKINEILPELELQDLLFNPEKETDIIKKIKGTKYMVSRIPIIVNDETIDAMAIVRDIDEIQKMEEKIRQDIVATGHYAKYTFDDVIGCSRATKETIRIGKEYAKVSSTVLIEGETGTGKEVIAQSIHNYSNRANRPFVAVNCAALPESLLESELFGYAPGAFTGADRKGKRGLFELAHGGTIFLDEIAEMNMLLQGRLLRVLQEKQVMRVGGNKLIPIDVRVIAATNKNLISLVNFGKFREDLYYRLNVLKMVLIPLRKRREDILCLLDYFIEIYCRKLKKKTIILSPEVKEYLLEYDWPGNVRELRNFCERLVVMATKKKISLKDINSELLSVANINDRPCPTIDTFKTNNCVLGKTLNLDDMEKINIQLALKKTSGSIMNAAEELGISRTTLWRKMKKYNIEV